MMYDYLVRFAISQSFQAGEIGPGLRCWREPRCPDLLGTLTSDDLKHLLSPRLRPKSGDGPLHRAGILIYSAAAFP